MIALLLPHTGAHVAPHAAMLPVLPAIFRRAVAALRRKQAAPETPRPPGAATVLLTPPDGTPVLGGKMIADVRAEYGKAYPRPTYYGRHDGSVVVNERNEVHVRPVNGRSLGDLPRRKPMVNRQPWQTAEMPVYGQAPVAEVLAAGQEGRLAS